MEPQKFALVTGGSEGVGFAVAQMLHRREFFILLIARNSEKLVAAKEKLGGDRVAIFCADVTELSDIERLYAEIKAVTERIDVLVNSAGTFKWDNSGVDLMLLNAQSKEFMTRTFAPLLSSGAIVINVSSQAALFSDDDPRRQGEIEYVDSMRRVDTFSADFARENPDVRVFVSHPPLMKGKIAEEQFRGRAGFEGIDFDALPGPEIVAHEIEQKFFC